MSLWMKASAVDTGQLPFLKTSYNDSAQSDVRTVCGQLEIVDRRDDQALITEALWSTQVSSGWLATSPAFYCSAGFSNRSHLIALSPSTTSSLT